MALETPATFLPCAVHKGMEACGHPGRLCDDDVPRCQLHELERGAGPRGVYWLAEQGDKLMHYYQGGADTPDDRMGPKDPMARRLFWMARARESAVRSFLRFGHEGGGDEIVDALDKAARVLEGKPNGQLAAADLLASLFHIQHGGRFVIERVDDPFAGFVRFYVKISEHKRKKTPGYSATGHCGYAPIDLGRYRSGQAAAEVRIGEQLFALISEVCRAAERALPYRFENTYTTTDRMEDQDAEAHKSDPS